MSIRIGSISLVLVTTLMLMCVSLKVSAQENILPKGSSALESSHVVKVGQGTMEGFHVDTDATAVVVMLIDGATTPADGAVAACVDGTTARPCILSRWQVPANVSAGISVGIYPVTFIAGAILVCSATGALFTKTATPHCAFSLIQNK